MAQTFRAIEAPVFKTLSGPHPKNHRHPNTSRLRKHLVLTTAIAGLVLGIGGNIEQAAAYETVTITSTDTPLVIAGPATTTSIINVNVLNNPPIVDVDVVLDMNHTWFGDLDVSLEAPSTTNPKLFSHLGGGAFGWSENASGVYTFDDDAGTNINVAGFAETDAGLSDDEVIAGTYTSESGSALGAFDGQNANGNWTLSLVDTYPADDGTLFSWSLVLTFAGCGPAGSPAGQVIECDINNLSGNYSAGGGDDTIYINAGIFDNNIGGGGGNDIINVNNAGAIVNGNLSGGGEADILNLTAGTLGNVFGNGGGDTFNVNGATVGSIDGGGGKDTLNWSSGALGSFSGGKGGDEAYVSSPTYDGSQILDGGAGTDLLNLNGITVNVPAGKIVNWETIALGGGANVTADGIVTQNLSVIDSIGTFSNLMAPNVAVCNGSLTLGGASAVGNIDGCVSDDTTVAVNIDGAGGSDIINVFGNASVLGGVRGGTNGADVSAADDTGDMITINTTGTVGFVRGNLGDDIIDLLNGNVVGNVVGGEDNDTITLNGATVAGRIRGGTGEDALSLLSGSAMTVRGNGGNDTIILDGATITAEILGQSGDDEIFLLAGSAAEVRGGTGNDLISLGGAAISGDIIAGVGDDAFIWSSGTVANFDGGNGSDTALVTAAEYNGSQILDGGDDYLIADGWVDTLTFSGLNLNVPGANIINWENVVIDGGTIVFSDNMFEVGSGPGLDGLTLKNGTVLDVTAAPLSIIGNLTNNAIVDMQDGATGDSVNVSGNYAGMGDLLVDVDFTGDVSDTLVVGGDVTGGPTTIDFNDVSTGDASGNDVLVVDVAGSTAAGDFIQSGEIVAGGFLYDLNLMGGGWYLQSTVLPQVEGYAPALTVMQDMGRDYIGNLWERFGHRETGWQANGRGEGSGIWGRAHGKLLHAGSDATSTGASFESNHGFLQAGFDFAGFDMSGGDLVLSVMGHYGKSDSDVDNASGVASANVDNDGYGVGGSLTFYNAAQTFYADVVGQVTWYDASIAAAGRRASGKTDGFGYAMSLEAGYRHAISEQMSFVPQAQLTYSNADFDTFTDTDGVITSALDGDSLEGRIGFALERNADDSTGYARINLVQEFEGKNRIDASGTRFGTSVHGTSVEMSAGGSVLLRPGFRLYGDFTGRAGVSNEVYSARGTIGGKVSW